MQTNFAPSQLADPDVAHSEKILRKCVHCGFCTATCPTYLTLGNELDSPRGRIYLIKDMLESGRAADETVATHIDRCLSCLSCMTTCPSGVDYMHLVDHARVHIERTYRRPLPDRLIRALLAFVLPYPRRFRASLTLARLARPLAPVLDRAKPLKPLAAMLRLAPNRKPARAKEAPLPSSNRRVAILSGCAQSVLDPEINAAATRLLARFGIATVPAPGETCCGALVHHMGRETQARDFARQNIEAWERLIEDGGLDAILVTTSGCGTTVKDYGHMLREDPAYASRAARISGLALDISEYLARLDLPEPEHKAGLVVAYHSACSMQHGQRVTRQPKALLSRAGFVLRDVPEGHICCGSAGTYNILQPEIAATLRDRKIANILKTAPQCVATGNIGCITQIGSKLGLPILHTVQLLDWAYGGERPAALVASGP
ncbi:glycolate oxidase subunit GlcF [Aureimonas psammosilenae]|uniref:glycolate oxidase subunit GlcF n=1 Tax=Aureimonas psammosilenae TaxID=2495496 RepID=UPI0012611CFE|nr:glycolate oxidase subunit GlcF [Aureimonas psammosilenae]